LKHIVLGALACATVGLVGCADLLGFKTFHEVPVDAGTDAGSKDAGGTFPDAASSETGPASACMPACDTGETCQNGQCACDPATCTGCCTKTACSVSWPACGLGGGACAACDLVRSDRCDATGACACGTMGLCGVGQKCAGGGCTCDPTMCSGTCCGDACVQTASATTDCGACGHSCLGAVCSGGECAPTTLATTGGPAWAMTLTPTQVFWTAAQGIYSCPLTGCDAAAPAGPYGLPNATYPYKSRSTMAYWSAGPAVLSVGDPGTGSNVFSVGLDGSNPSVIHGADSGWTLDDGLVYWFDSMTSSVSNVGVKIRVPKTIMTNVPGGEALAADANNVYVATGQSLLACSKTMGSCGSSLLTISAVGTPVMVATEPDSQFVYFASGFALYRCPYSGCPDPSNVSPWTQAQGNVGAIVADANAVYWTDSKNGTVLKCAHGATCANPTTIASGLPTPEAIALDDTWVYWTLGAGSVAVQRAPK
jgi:hypothetical protein